MVQDGSRGAVVAIEGPTGVLHRVARIQPYRAGFALLTPYHAARAGFLCRFPVDYSKRTMRVPVVGAEVVSYSAANRVKLSFHEDGFVQFSGEVQGTILSGRDATGRPKGMGLMVNPLGEPLATALGWLTSGPA